MYYYIPENLYNSIKDDPEYIKYTGILDSFDKPKTFEESFYNYYNLTQKCGDTIDQYRKYLTDFAKAHCDIESLPMKLTQYGHTITKDELLGYWVKKDTLSNEEKLFLIGYIHNLSYEDGSYLNWSKEYVTLYEGLSEDERKKLSAYCYENYITKGVEYYATNMVTNKVDNFLEVAIAKAKELLNDVLKYDESSDTLKHNYYESLRFIIYCIGLNYPDTAAKQISDFSMDKFFDQKFQYKAISYAIMDIFDKVYDIFICDRDFKNAFYVLKHMFKYVDFGLKDPGTFFRALEYYDKVNQYGMLCIVRKMIRISRYMPGLDLSLKNLSADDENFIMSQSFDLDKIISSSVRYTFTNYLNKSDTMVNVLVPIYEMLKDDGIDKRIKRILDGEKIEVFPTMGEIISGKN